MIFIWLFGVAWAYVAHTDSRFDPEMLGNFVSAYQRVQPLTIGELWAVAITLRVVLVENLRRIAERLVRNRQARVEADLLADKVLGTAGQTQVPAEVLVKECASAGRTSFEVLQPVAPLEPDARPLHLGRRVEMNHARLAALGAVLGTNPKDNVANQPLSFFIAAGDKDPLLKDIVESKNLLLEKRFPVLFREMKESGKEYCDKATFTDLVLWLDSLDRL